MADYVRRADAERIAAAFDARLAAILAGVFERIEARVRTGEDPQRAAIEECHRGIAQADAATAAIEREVDAVAIEGPE